MFGSDKDLGEGMLVAADAISGGSGANKTVHCGNGQVVFKSSFAATETSSTAGGLSPQRGLGRKFLTKSPRESRQSTPADG